MVKYDFYVRIDLRKRPLLSRLASYGRHSSDTTSVTPGFKNKTECITICMPGSSSIHTVTSSVNNQQQYHEKWIKRLQRLSELYSLSWKRRLQTSQAIDRGLRRPRTQQHLQKTSHHFLLWAAIITSVSTLMGIIWHEGQKQGKADWLTAISNFSWSSFISTWLLRYKFIPKTHIKRERRDTA
jgi:hypothetical protein